MTRRQLATSSRHSFTDARRGTRQASRRVHWNEFKDLHLKAAAVQTGPGALVPENTALTITYRIVHKPTRRILDETTSLARVDHPYLDIVKELE